MLRIAFSNDRREVRTPAIFIDRDGVINVKRPGDYVLNWSQFVFVPGIRAALRELLSLGLPLIIISNQAAVGKGLLSIAVLEEITASLHRSLLGDGTALSAAYYCPHKADEDCVCRKPKPGLLFKAAEDFNIDLRRSIFIGDSDIDMQAALAAGCASVLFGADNASQSLALTELPIARSVTDLFPMVAKCLRAKEHV